MKYISNINVSESSPKKSDSSALTVYFSEKGEKLWDIARRYNTTVQAIADENEIYDECIGEERMILIPRV
jgi:LysM repeat protein